MRDNNLGKNIALGVAAGLLATIALQLIRNAIAKQAPETTPPMKEEPGTFMVRKAEQKLPDATRDKIPEKIGSVAARVLGIGYGMTFGSFYAAARPRGGNPLMDGTLLGIGTWAAGYLGWLPATRLMPPVWKQSPKQVWIPIAQHALYGIAAVSTYDWMSKKLNDSSASS